MSNKELHTALSEQADARRLRNHQCLFAGHPPSLQPPLLPGTTHGQSQAFDTNYRLKTPLCGLL